MSAILNPRNAASFMGARAYNSTTQSIANASVVALTFNSEEFDTNAIHDISTNPSRFTVPTGGAGYWAASLGGSWAISNAGARYMLWKKNGSILRGAETLVTSLSSAAPHSLQSTMPVILLADADYIEGCVYQTSGGSLNFGDASVDENRAALTFYRVG